MNVPQADLDLWRRYFETLRLEMRRASIQGGVGARERVLEILHQTEASASRMGVRLDQAGAQRPPEMPPRSETPLELLDTPANRRYLDALRAAYDAGLAVDRERYGETIGSDGEAQVLEMLIVDKQLEIFGPARDESRVG